MKVFNLVLTGVGGQGILTMAQIIQECALRMGYEVRGVELHGLAQRGGSIPTHVRFGHNFYSPSVPEGEADLIIAMEPLEAVRALKYANEDTPLLVNTFKFYPITVTIGKEKYPSLEELKKVLPKKTYMLDVWKRARELFGKVIYANAMMIGIAIGNDLLPLDAEIMEAAIKEKVPRGVENNLRAFREGLNWKLDF